jgi:predicted Zn finger-like uncharacterized protein
MAKKKTINPQKNPDSPLLSTKCPYCKSKIHVSDAIGIVLDEGYVLKCPKCEKIFNEVEEFEQDLTPFLEEPPKVAEEPKKRTKKKKE